MSAPPPPLRTIGEVAAELGVAAHVLRFWEARFPEVAPLKRAGGRRYYRAADVALLGAIRDLAHARGMTLAGIERLLAERGAAGLTGTAVGGGPTPPSPPSPPPASAMRAGADWRGPVTAARDRLAAALAAYHAA